MQMIPLLLVPSKLEKHMTKICEWLLHNFLKANVKRFHLSLNRFVEETINVENFTIKWSYAEVFWGITIDSNLSFSEHVTYLCATAHHKSYALSHVSKDISIKSVVYLWSHSIFPNSVTALRGINNKINHIHERALRIA